MGTQCNYVKEHCEKANAEEKKPWQCTTTTKKWRKNKCGKKEHHDKLGLWIQFLCGDQDIECNCYIP